MLLFEGSVFVILLLLTSLILFFLYLKNQLKTKTLQTFFAGLTHELKTPLASIKLQSEVIQGLTRCMGSNHLQTLISRLIEDSYSLETKLDKILHLSKIELGSGRIILAENIDIVPFIKKISKEHPSKINITISSSENKLPICADHFSLEIIFRNLIENSINHIGITNKIPDIKIDIKKQNNKTILTYSDENKFKGDQKKIGTLFYKGDRSKGSGVGIYLIKKLMTAMDGETKFIFADNFKTVLTFKSRNEKDTNC